MAIVNNKKLENINNLDFHKILKTVNTSSWAVSYRDFKYLNLQETQNLHHDDVNGPKVKGYC